MTRDEAIAAVRAVSVFDGNALEDGQFVDRLAAIGLLKLDEPESVEERVWELLKDRQFNAEYIWTVNRYGSLSREAVDLIISILAVAGFKISEA